MCQTLIRLLHMSHGTIVTQETLSFYITSIVREERRNIMRIPYRLGKVSSLTDPITQSKCQSVKDSHRSIAKASIDHLPITWENCIHDWSGLVSDPPEQWSRESCWRAPLQWWKEIVREYHSCTMDAIARKFWAGKEFRNLYEVGISFLWSQ